MPDTPMTLNQALGRLNGRTARLASLIKLSAPSVILENELRMILVACANVAQAQGSPHPQEDSIPITTDDVGPILTAFGIGVPDA